MAITPGLLEQAFVHFCLARSNKGSRAFYHCTSVGVHGELVLSIKHHWMQVTHLATKCLCLLGGHRYEN